MNRIAIVVKNGIVEEVYTNTSSAPDIQIIDLDTTDLYKEFEAEKALKNVQNDPSLKKHY